jgi:hypothetical protein
VRRWLQAGTGGAGVGGTSQIVSFGGTVTVGDLRMANNGVGGAGDAAGGEATGGNATLSALELGVITGSGSASLQANATGGAAAAGNGGAATGGATSLSSHGSSVTFAGAVGLAATARGGAAESSGNGGRGQGGTASIETNSFQRSETATRIGTVSVAGGVGLNVGGAGGSGSATGTGGAGTGGEASIVTNSGAMSLGGADIASLGRGGAGGAGGAGTGGRAQLRALVANISVTGDVDLSSSGVGGAGSQTGDGGNGTGGLAEVSSRNAGLSFANAFVSSAGVGGNGRVGGAGQGGLNTANLETSAPNAGAFVSAQNGSITGQSLSVSTFGTGGESSGGAGGNGVGGSSSVTALNGQSASLIDIDTVFINAGAQGGRGGTLATGEGAAGGIGEAGQAFLLAQAVNGGLVIDDASVSISGAGGSGGRGADNTEGTGGVGGQGGSGLGGFTNFGTSSGAATLETRQGSATFGTLVAAGNGTGGAGGSGGSGMTAGAGGVGGTGLGGRVTLLVRGSRLTATAVGLSADGAGGVGGLQGDTATTGASGSGVGGSAGLLATNFFNGTEPARVEIGTLSASASGVAASSGGDGQLAAGGSQRGDVFIEVARSSARFETVALSALGTSARQITVTGANGETATFSDRASTIRGDNGAIAVTGSASLDASGDFNFAMTGTGTLAVGGLLDADAGGTVRVSHSARPGDAFTIDAGSFRVSAANYVVEPGRTCPRGSFRFHHQRQHDCRRSHRDRHGELHFGRDSDLHRHRQRADDQRDVQRHRHHGFGSARHRRRVLDRQPDGLADGPAGRVRREHARAGLYARQRRDRPHTRGAAVLHRSADRNRRQPPAGPPDRRCHVERLAE